MAAVDVAERDVDVTRAARLALNGFCHEARCDAVLDADRFGQVSVLLDYC